MSQPTSKRFSKKHLITSVILLSVTIAVIVVMRKGLTMDTTQIPSALINKKAHNFEVSWLQGREFLNNTEAEKFSLSDFKGEPVILNFWASWCFSCRQEAHDFERFWQNYQSKGVKVVGIAIQDTPEAALEFAKSYGKTYILGLDNEGAAAIDYGVTGVPETFLINSEGVIIYKEAGPVSEQKLEKFASLLMEAKNN